MESEGLNFSARTIKAVVDRRDHDREGPLITSSFGLFTDCQLVLHFNSRKGYLMRLFICAARLLVKPWEK